MSKQVDYIIIGQGICGTLLSYYLMQHGKTVLVIDAPEPNTASKVASGLINPVTGKKWVTTWLAHELLPTARQAYKAMEAQFGLSLVHEYDLMAFHPTPESQELFEARIEEDDTYLYPVINEKPWEELFHFHFGIGGVTPCMLVDVPKLLAWWRNVLLEQNAMLEATFHWEDCKVYPDNVHYGDFNAQKIICCGGAADMDNPYFTRLPFQLNKGEAIIASIPGLPRTHLYKHGVISIVPWKDDLFWIGSIFDREYMDELPTAAFRKTVEITLQRWLKLPFEMVGHLAALRPATGGQKPFAGLHPLHSVVGIFNGMGSKGCSQGPYFAKQFAAHLVHGTALMPDADINRFVRILSRP